MLTGRSAEKATIDRLLADARSGRSGVLVIRGEAGIGKTALLDHAVATAEDMQVVRGVGAEFERTLPFAGLHQVLRRFTDRLGSLPEAQARALQAALGLGQRPVTIASWSAWQCSPCSLTWPKNSPCCA